MGPNPPADVGRTASTVGDAHDRTGRNDPVRTRLARHGVGIAVVLVLAWSLGAAGAFPVAPWVVPTAFLVVSLGIAVTYRAFPRPSGVHADVRAAAQSIGLAAVAYSTGWGFVLPLVHLFAVADNLDEGGSGATSASLRWATVGTVGGQVAIALGVAPLAIDDVTTSHLLAAASLLLVVLVARRLVRATRARERARRDLLRREERFRALVEDAADVVLVLGEDHHVRWSSPSTGRVLGRDLDERTSYLDLVHPDDRPRVGLLLEDAGNEDVRPGPTLFRLAVGDGWLEVEGLHRDLRDTPAVAGYVASLRDVSERQRLHAEIERSRTRDAVTGLANRRALVAAVDGALVGDGRAALLELHVVGLRGLVLADGREAADLLLREVAHRLEGLPGHADLLARTDDQVLALLLAHADDEALDRVARAAHRLASEVCATHDSSLRVAIGVATAEDGDGPGDLQQCARIAAEHAMAPTGTIGIERFLAGMRLELERRVEIERSLPGAIDGGQFRLVYQPLLSIGGDHRLVGVEALLRWTHPKFGALSPGVFIPIAERTGRIVELGGWVLEEAVRQLVAWDDQLGTGAVRYVSVNVSARQLAHGDLVDRVRRAVDGAGLSPDRLLLELTESALADDAAAAVAHLQQLSALGVRLALDDFGTGWASMASLQDHPFDVVKIDKSFVAHTQQGRRPQMLASMVALGRELGLQVVAEGVETVGELEEVRSLGAHLAQGWLLGRPVPPAAIADRVATVVPVG